MSDIAPCLLFDGQAEEAARFYVAVFGGSIDHVSHYPDDGAASSPGAGSAPGGKVLLVEFTLLGRRYQALNGPARAFTEALSLSVACRDQAELDRLFDALTADGGSPGPCGWIRDKYGLSWQLVPEAMMAHYRDGDRAGIARMMTVMMTMGKLDLATLQAAYEGVDA